MHMPAFSASSSANPGHREARRSRQRHERVATAVSEGELSTSDASAVSNVIANVGRAIELHQLADRIAALEAASAAKGND